MCGYVRDFKSGCLPTTVLSYEGTNVNVSVTVPSYFFLGGGDEGVLEERDVDTSEIHKGVSKLPGYEGGRLSIHNVDRGGNALEVANI